jgi:hypothetical protein
MKVWHSSAKSFLLLAIGAVGGACLVNPSWSQNQPRAVEGTEVGRYQYVGGHVFDTKTARLWSIDNQTGKYVRGDAPWEWNQKPHQQSVPDIPDVDPQFKRKN